MIKIGHARMDENGKITGGQAGDQTGKEVCITDFYVHSKGWHVLRAKNAATAEAIAKCMEDACANPNVGYDQVGRLTLYNTVKALNFKCDINTLKVKVECDCSSLARVCLAYAGVHVANFSTANEKDVILATGLFELVECKANGSNLKRGDILVTKTKGHTAVVLNDGADHQVKVETPAAAPSISAIVGTAIAKESMRVRNAASTANTTTIGYVSKGQKVEVLEVLSNGWYKIVWKDGIGYTSNVNNKFYTYTPVAQGTQPKGIKVGDTVRVNRGSRTYDGRKLASFVYARDHIVKEIKGDRVVITYTGIVVAAVHKDNLTLV